MTNSKAADTDHYYTSRLPGKPLDGVGDVHTHPAEPFSVRVGPRAQF